MKLFKRNRFGEINLICYLLGHDFTYYWQEKSEVCVRCELHRVEKLEKEKQKNMKTIKELEADMRHEECKFVHQGLIQQLKDVLGVIDEFKQEFEDYGADELGDSTLLQLRLVNRKIEELKKRITGK